MSSPRIAERGPWVRELREALAAAAAASTRALRHYADFTAIPDAPAAISTAADADLQELILTRLAEAFPADAFCAEEATPTLARLQRHGVRRWIIDPIDGTRGFARKNGEFSVMIGLVEGDDPVVGVVAEPVTGRVTYAVKDRGCWTYQGNSGEDQRCAVSAVTRLEDATILTSHAASKLHLPVLDRAARRRTSYSAGLKLALIARGEADLYLRLHLFHSWDVCAGQILVEEAGGTVADAQGHPIRYSQLSHETIHGIQASNGHLAWVRAP